MPGPSNRPPEVRSDFIRSLAAATGLDPHVVQAWVEVEGADGPGGTGGYNYLNVRAKGALGYSGVAIPSTSQNGFAQFGSVQDAVTETAYWINSMPNYSVIRSSTHLGPKSQLAAIASSPWDAGHYNGGRSLTDKYNSLVGARNWVTSIVTDPGKVGGAIAGGINSGAKAVVPGLGAAESVGTTVASVGGAVLNPSNWLRGGYIIGGGLLILLGAVLLARSVGVSPPSLSMPDLGGGGGEEDKPLGERSPRAQKRAGFYPSDAEPSRAARLRKSASAARMSEAVPF